MTSSTNTRLNNIEIQSLSDIEQVEKSHAWQDLEHFESTYDAIKASAEQRPNAEAIAFFLKGDDYDKAHSVSYRSLLENITRSANFFNAIGLKDDDVVAFIMPNLPETHYLIWGGEAACRVLAINPLLEAGQIKDLINSVGAKAVATMNPMVNIDLWPKLASILPELTATEHVIGVDIAHYVNGPAGFAAKAIQSANRLKIKLPKGKRYHNFTSALKKQNKNTLQFKRHFDEDTISSLFCTGGTTGLPKIARRTHQNELANVTSVSIVNGPLLEPGQTILGGLPLFHVNGALVTGLMTFVVGARVVMATPQGYRGENVISKFWDIVEHHKVNAFSGVPTVYSTLMNFPIDGKDISSLEMGICGAAPMPVETFKAFQDKTGVKILEGYGLTEGTCVSSINPYYGAQKVGSIGLRIPYQQMMAVQVDDDQITRQCEVDEIGALVVRGPNVFQGYQLEHQNKGLWLYDDEGRRWMNTGDLARQDADGYFWLTGRKKELIVRGGHNIEPKMIEEAMCKHPAINLAAAVGKPDVHAGEVPVCYVQVDANQTVDVDELLAFAEQEVPERAAVPKEIRVVSELPLTAVGKVFKPQLEMQEIELCVQSLARAELPENEVKITVSQDPKLGILASVEIMQGNDELTAHLSRKLGQFTFKSQCS